MPRINAAHQSFIILDERGEAIETCDSVQTADAMAIECARSRPGKNYFVAMVIARFGVPNVAPTKIELLANDMVDAPEAPVDNNINPAPVFAQVAMPLGWEPIEAEDPDFDGPRVQVRVRP